MTSKRRTELFRNTREGKIAGVCAGIANYFGWEAWLVRILAVSGVLLGMGWFIVIYIAGWFILDKTPSEKDKTSKKTNKYSSASSQSFNEEVVSDSIKVKSRIWQAGEPPKQAFRDIRTKFSRIERELRLIEQYVTSAEFTVSREINKL
jgi:phage shock protein C